MGIAIAFQQLLTCSLVLYVDLWHSLFLPTYRLFRLASTEMSPTTIAVRHAPLASSLQPTNWLLEGASSLAIISIILGSIYTLICVIEGFGLFAAATVSEYHTGQYSRPNFLFSNVSALSEFSPGFKASLSSWSQVLASPVSSSILP